MPNEWLIGYSSCNTFVDNWSKHRKKIYVSSITYAYISNHLCLVCMCKWNCYKPSSNCHRVLQTDGPEYRQPGCDSWIQTVFGECRVSSQECFSGWMPWVCSNPVRVYVKRILCETGKMQTILILPGFIQFYLSILIASQWAVPTMFCSFIDACLTSHVLWDGGRAHEQQSDYCSSAHKDGNLYKGNQKWLLTC